MADYSFKGYDNFVLAEEIKSILDTKLDMNRFLTVDYSLAEQPGMKKIIHTYTGTGAAEDLGRGDKNSVFVDAEYSSREYEVARTQAQAKWFDDDQMTDPTLIDAKLRYLSEGMVNNWTQKAIAEYAKTNQSATCTNFDLADWADAIAIYANQYESQEGLFALCSIDMVPTLRKMLGANLMYVEAYIRTGAIGTILGVPIYTSKALPKGIIFLATREAVTAFVKREVNVEQDRDIDSKENQVVASRYSVIALTDATRCIMMGKAQGTAASITTATKAGTTVAGAATTGAKVVCYVNGERSGNAATAAGSSYSITVDEALAAGDVVKVVAELEGFLPSSASVEVAE